jgi:transcriptional regulator with XRE-family HTH domain
MSTGENIRRLRRAKDLSQEELAQISGISRVTISAVEGGKSGEEATLIALARALNVTVDQLREDVSDQVAKNPFLHHVTKDTPKEKIYQVVEAMQKFYPFLTPEAKEGLENSIRENVPGPVAEQFIKYLKGEKL